MNKPGKWITAESTQPFYVRKTITLKEKPVSAHACVSGLGQFVFYVNGQKVSDHELDPAWSDYRKYVEYIDFDVTGMLHDGENALGAEVANGWYIMDNTGYSFHFPSFMPKNPDPYQPFGRNLVFALELIVTYADGRQEVWDADESFKVCRHPVVHSNVYGSEWYDASLVQKGWCSTGFDDSSWLNASLVDEKDVPKGIFLSQIRPAIKVIHTYYGVYMHTVHHRDIYDFSQNMAAMLEFDVIGRKGDTVKIYPAEKLDESGDVDQMAKGWLPIDTVITYKVGSDDKEHYRERFSYLGMRYIAVEYSSDNVHIENIKAHAITSAWKKDGTFICDDDRYNKIYHMIERTVEANMMSVHTDCPTIERFAWEEQNHLMAPSIMFMKDGRHLWKKFLLDMRCGQHTKNDFFHDRDGRKIPAGDGLVPSQCPCYIPNFLPVPGMGSFYDSIAWSSSIILCVKWHYLFYGDKRIIKDNFAAGLKYLQYLKTKLTPEGFISHGLGDWGNPDHEYARENVETAFLYADVTTLADLAAVIQRDEETELRDWAEKIKKNYNEKLLVKDKDGKYAYRCFDQPDSFVMSQACEAMPLYWHMVPAEAEKDVADAFRRTLEEKGCLAAGEIGLPYVIQTASAYGMNDLIAAYIMRDEHPSYYAFIKDGMTTLGEYWENNPRSHCHDMLGTIIEWYYTAIAGIQIRKPGFEEISIHPYMPESINTFDCTYNSVRGPVHIHGERKEGTPVFTWNVPDTIKVINNETE